MLVVARPHPDRPPSTYQHHQQHHQQQQQHHIYTTNNHRRQRTCSLVWARWAPTRCTRGSPSMAAWPPTPRTPSASLSLST
jgi:hypothetical protein